MVNWKNKIFTVLMGFLLGFLLTFPLKAQYLRAPELSGVGLPFFHAELFPTFTKDGQQQILRVYIQMLNDDLTFVKADSGFKADVVIEFFLTDDQDKTILNRSVERTVFTTDFQETNSREISQIFHTDLPIDSGNYKITVTVLDKNSNKQVNRKISFRIPSFKRAPFLISQLLFFNHPVRDSLGRIIDFKPNLTHNFSGGEKYVYLYFNTIAFTNTDSLTITLRILDAQNNENQHNIYVVKNPTHFKSHFIRLNRYQFDQNRYTAKIIARMGNFKYQIEKVFSFFWTVSPESPKDLSMALEQMIYIADEDSVDYYLKRSYDEQKKYFEKFWAEMDPNPETEKNELMDEYYRRVNYANQNFTTLSSPGWRTDRGRIFIKFGEPDEIERHPFEMGSLPYEIWRYFNLKKVFLFIDRTGFGDYYLHPSFIEEEYN